MKGDRTLRVLEVIGVVATNAADVVGAFLEAGYGASRGRLERTLREREWRRGRERVREEKARRALQRYYSLIYKLREDGLIREEGKDAKRLLALTSKGKQKLAALRKRRAAALPETSYPKQEEANTFIVVAFDIPEKESRKRYWIRAALKNIGLRMIQKSVWIGKTKIPEQFLSDLRKMMLIEFVEIFEISKTGSLKHLL